MATANRDTLCTSCGDTITLGDKITIKDRTDKKTKDILCFRCHPDSVDSGTPKPKLVEKQRQTLQEHRRNTPSNGTGRFFHQNRVRYAQQKQA